MGVASENSGSSMSETWSARHMLHIEHIDAQHRDLADAIETLRSAIVGGDYEAIETHLEMAVALMDAHFEDEELFMAEYEYPGIQCHVMVHAEFLQEAVELLTRVRARTCLININFCDRMRNRFEDHVDVQDRRFAEYCRTAVRKVPEEPVQTGDAVPGQQSAPE
jgi:hemerythrin-like metal-binding protein